MAGVISAIGTMKQDKTNVPHAILEFSTHTRDECLELLDGASDTPVHRAIRFQLFDSLRAMLERRSDLLYHENATGRTPAEMAEDVYLAERVNEPPSLPNYSNYSILNQSSESFVKSVETSRKTERERIWALCQQKMSETPRTRRLVSLFEANEAAKRLVLRQSAQQASRKRTGEHNEAEEEHDVVKSREDEMQKWYGVAAQWADRNTKNEDSEP